MIFAVVVGFARTHTTIGLHYDRCEQRICGIIVSQIHFILQSSNGWDTQTNTHTLQIWRFFDSILSIFNTIFHKFATSLVFYALSFLALSLCVVEPLLYFRTMSTITKTSCCDDTTLLYNKHNTTQDKGNTNSHWTTKAGRRRRIEKNIRTNGCVQLYEMNAASRMRLGFEFQLKWKKFNETHEAVQAISFHFHRWPFSN